MKVQKLSIFTDVLVVLAQILLCWLPWQQANLRERNIDELFLGDYVCTLKISAKFETIRAQPTPYIA